MRKLFVFSITLLILFISFIGVNWNGTTADIFRGNLQRTGVYDSEVPENNTLLWSFHTGSPIQSSPVVENNRVFFGSDNGKVYSLDALSGREIWNFATGNAVKSTPTVVGDVVYFGSTDRNLYALDAESGNKLWNYTLASFSAQIWSSPVVAYDKIFFGASDGNLYALNATTHELEWSYPTGMEIQSSPAVNWPFVYIGSLNGKVYSIWIDNGTENWNFSSDLSKSSHGIYASPMISNGRLYIGSEDYNLYCIDAQTGVLIWNFTAPYKIYSSASISNGQVFIHPTGESWDAHLYALPEDDPNGDGIINDSEIIWSFETEDKDGGSSPTVVDGKVLVGSSESRLYCVNESDGEEQWNLTTGGIIVASPTVANGIVYITCEDRTLYAIGGDMPAVLDIQIIPEFPSIKSNRIMGITFQITYRGAPVEGAFLNFEVDLGNLSQSGASTFSDGTQRIKFTAPEVYENTTVTVSATATKFGYTDGESQIQFIVESTTSYGDVKTGSTFSLSKYWLYLVIIIALIVLNILILILGAKKRNYDRNKQKSDEGDMD